MLTRRDVVLKAKRIALPIQSVHGTGIKKNVTRITRMEKKEMEDSQYHTS